MGSPALSHTRGKAGAGGCHACDVACALTMATAGLSVAKLVPYEGRNRGWSRVVVA